MYCGILETIWKKNRPIAGKDERSFCWMGIVIFDPPFLLDISSTRMSISLLFVLG